MPPFHTSWLYLATSSRCKVTQILGFLQTFLQISSHRRLKWNRFTAFPPLHYQLYIKLSIKYNFSAVFLCRFPTYSYFCTDSDSSQGQWGHILSKKGRLRTLSSRSKSHKFELSSKERNENVHIGCIVSCSQCEQPLQYHTTWAIELLILRERQCENLGPGISE